MSQQHTNNMSFLDLVWRYKFSLVVYIFLISTVTFIGLYAFGGVPDELKDQSGAPQSAFAAETMQPLASSVPVKNQIAVAGNVPLQNQQGELPTRVIIDKVGVNTVVNNPNSTDENVLDNTLLRGAVRYPGSGTLGHGNMFIFAHNTSIRIVNNQAYKAFNHLKDLKAGDIVRIQSATREYAYSVTSVMLATSDEAFINLATSKNMVTLTTCNVLGEKAERYIVQAEFVGSTPLQSNM